MKAKSPPDTLAEMLLGVTRSLVAREERDLSARQLAVFLTVYLDKEPHTARGLAMHLKIAPAAITRALDRLSDLDLVLRTINPRDYRSIFVIRRQRGKCFLGNWGATH